MFKTFATDRTGLVGKAFDAPLINWSSASIESKHGSRLMQNNISARVLSLKAVSLWVVLKWYILPRQRHLQLREGKRRHVTNWRNKRWPGVVFVLRANCAQNQTSFQRFQTLTAMLSNSCQQVSLCICVGKNQTSQMVSNFSTCDLTAAPLISLSLNILMAPKFRLF